jgi:chromosome segregation ATPase
MEKSCKTKEAEWAEVVKVRAEELVAITETIKILNDDDALELFKKTLPSASASFVQVQVGTAEMRSRATAVLRDARRAARADRARIDAILLTLRGKTVGFEKIIGMIDGQIEIIKKEQLADDHEKEYCAAQFDESEDTKKGLERSISDSETAIANVEEGIATLKEEIDALEDGIKALDKSVTEATEQRKEENEEYTELMASDSAAKELLGIAKNRLNKFYNPKLYKPPPKRVLSDEDSIVVSMGGTLAPTQPPGGIAGTGVTVLTQVSARTAKAAPPPPPETFGAYSKKSEDSNGVIAMIDLMVKDLDKEMQVAEVDEKDAQADYEEMMADSKEKRAADSKSLTEKESSKAALEDDLESHKEAKAASSEELMATEEYIHSLHTQCDWLLKYFDVRAESRVTEIDALSKAKAVLSGADYSLLQRTARRFLEKKA